MSETVTRAPAAATTTNPSAAGAATARRGSDALLQAAVDEVLKVARRFIWLSIGLGVVMAALAFTGILNRIYIISYVSTTHSAISLESALIFWTITAVMLISLLLIQQVSVAAVASYAARKLAVPAVLAATQRAGRADQVASAAIDDIETMRNTLAGTASQVLVGAILTPLLIGLVILLHWAFALLALFFCVVLGVLSWLIVRNAQRAADLTGVAQARSRALAADAMRAGEAVLSMGLLRKLTPHWLAIATDRAPEAYRAERDAARLRTAMDFTLFCVRGCILLTAAALMFAGEQVMAVMAGALFILTRLTSPFAHIGQNAAEMGEGLAAWRRLRSMVRDSPAPPEGMAFPCPDGRLVAERVGFVYRTGQPPILRQIDLVVERGDIVGIVGASGAGKSTLLRVLLGIFRPSTGGVYLDGHATWQWDRADLAHHVGFLPQQPLLSRGTVADVIARMTIPNLPLVIDAAKRAGAHDIIVGLPQGYATEVEGTWQFSMGQRQRIALARALYGRPKVMLLDELAASLDAEGEAKVVQLLATLRDEGISVVFTTHRPALLAVATRVLALRNGVLVPAGTARPGARLPGRQAQLAGEPAA